MERIQKLLAAAGVGSRRGIEEWLRAGRLTVNGSVAKLGDRAGPGDAFLLDGQPLLLQQASATGVGEGAATEAGATVLLYNKPTGEVTTRHDPPGAADRTRWGGPAGRGGRLDVNTSGLLLFTNDGALAHRLMHPSFEVQRSYLARVRGTPGPDLPAKLLRGVMLEDGLARFSRVEARGRSEGHTWFEVTLGEGRNREVRRAFEALGHEVSRLKRLAYGPFRLPDELPAGKAVIVSGPELAQVLR